VLVEGLGSLSLLEEIAQAPPVSLSVKDGNVSLNAQCTVVVSDGDNTPEKMEGTDDVRIEGMPPQNMKTCLFDPSSLSPCDGLSTATAAYVEVVEAEEGWEHVGRGRRSDQGSSLEPSREGFERSLAFKRWARGRCFRYLERGHQVSVCRDYFRCIRCRRPGHRERFCRARSPAARDRSPIARAPC
jgi:hypothetical protein